MATDSAIDDGTQEAATSESSNEQSGQQSSSKDTITVEQFNELKRQIDLVNRQLQSDKDRAVKQTNQRLDGVEKSLKEVLQAAKSQGKSIDEVLDEYNQEETIATQNMLREMAQAWKAGQFPQSGSRQGQQSGVDVTSVLSDLELDASDVRVKEFASRQFASKEEAYKQGALLVKSISKTQPSDADKAESAGQRARPAGNQERLMQEYREGSKNLFGMQLTRYKQSMREKGLEIS